MNVYLFQFTKKINSTARPALSDGKEVICQLKEETSFLYPTIKVSPDIIGGTFSPSLFNYVYIPYWQRYYYIKDWVYLNGTWECSCSVDVLASFKTAIGSTSAYIIRAASQYNGDIIDGFYPTTSVYAIRKQSVSSDIYHTTLSGGTYVLGCINNQSSNRFGAVTYYALTDNQMASVLNYLFSSNIYNNSNISEMGEGLYKSLFDPFQYIVSCMWFPYPTTAISSGTTTDVKVGYWSTGINGKIANYLIKEIGFKTYQPIYRHPQIARGAYLDHAPYTRLTLYYAPFGEIPIDTSFMQFGNNNYLYGKVYVDFVTGVADCYISITDGFDIETTADPYRFITMRSAQIGVPIQISQVMSDYVASAGSVVGTLANAVTGNWGAVFGSITSSIQSAMPKVASKGSNGSLVEIAEPPFLIVENLQLVDENLNEFGRPLCNTRRINQLSGYIQCGEADHAFNGTREENVEINNYMKNGFYYE